MSRAVPIILFGWLALVFVFIFSPILFSVIFSFNSDRFPTIPLGSFTTQWYETIFADEGKLFIFLSIYVLVSGTC